jgi:hypothetical protein
MITTNINVPGGSEVLLASEGNFKVIMKQNGNEVKNIPFVSSEKGCLFRLREDTEVIAIGKNEVVSVVTDISNALEVLDIVPIEADVEMSGGMTLQDKMKALIHDYAQNYFGDNQMDKLEDVLNVDLDDDGIIGTSEVQDVVPEIPEPPAPTPPPAPEEPVQPPAEEPPASG